MEIKKATTEDIDEIVSLFGEYNFALKSKSWLKWKYFENPLGDAKMFKLLYKARLVGAVAIIPQLFYYCGRPVVGLQTVDGLLGREIRGKGNFNEVMHFLTTQKPDSAPEKCFYLSFPSLAVSVKAHENAGWYRLANFHLKSVLLNPEPVFRKRGLPLVGKYIALPWRMMMKMLLFRGSENVIVRKIESQLPDCNEFREDKKVAGDRSEAFLGWRVAENPRDRMVMLEFVHDNVRKGYAVCKFVKQSVEITEFRTTPDFYRKMTIALLQYIDKWRMADSVDFWRLGSDDLQATMPSVGFFTRHFTGALFVNKFQKCGLPETPEKWAISYLDSDW